MSKVAVFNLPATGHINPSLAVVKGLVEANEEVYYYGIEEFREKIEATGAVFLLLNMETDILETRKNPNLLATFAELTKLSYYALPQLMEEVKAANYDYMLCDVMTIWGQNIANYLNIPLILMHPVFLMQKKMMPLRLQLEPFKEPLVALYSMLKFRKYSNKMAKTYHLKPISIATFLFEITADLSLVFTSKKFQPFSEEYNESYKFIGPSIAKRVAVKDFPMDKIDATKPLLYISMGTIFNRKTKFYKLCMQVFKDSPFQVVLAIGNFLKVEDMGTIPANFIVCNYSPQVEILKIASVFVTHGGMNSISEAIYYEVPTVVMPHAGDQLLVGIEVEKQALGVELRHSQTTAITLQKAVDSVYQNSEIKANLNKMSQSFKSAGGYQRAVEEVLAFAEKLKNK